MQGGMLAFEIHALTARLDRAADRVLRAELNISYRRFLVLFMLRRFELDSQRALAETLDISEPSVSRMTGVLSRLGLLEVRPVPGKRRHAVTLTTAGLQVVLQGEALLSERLNEVLQRSGVPVEAYLRSTRRISAALEDAQESFASLPAGHARGRCEAGAQTG